LPDIRRNHCDRPAHVHMHRVGRVPVDLNARPPTVPIGLISRLRMIKYSVLRPRGNEFRKLDVRFARSENRCVDLISQPIIERPVRIDFPCVLDVGVHIIPV